MLERIGRRLTRSVLAWDILITLLALELASVLRLSVDIGQMLTDPQARWPWSLYGAVIVIWLVIFLLIRPQRSLFTGSLIEATGSLVGGVAVASLVFAGLLYLSFRDVSRLLFLYFAALDLILLLAFHLAVRVSSRLRRPVARRRRVLFVGNEPAAAQLAREFQRHTWSGLTVVGCTSDDPAATGDMHVLGGVKETARIVEEAQIDELIFALPHSEQERVVQISFALLQHPVMLHMVPGAIDLAFARTPVGNLGGVPLVSLRESALTDTQRTFKRLFDIFASLILLVLLTPLLLFIALLIKLETAGPIFFVQERIGEHGRRFKLLKFRTMYQDAERRWREIAQTDESGRLLHKLQDDPRVTPLGRRLRRSSLDELPQLINVLRGEMSLVGPRPEMPYIAAEYQPWQWQRFRVPPGMTGWWQINGRSDRPMHLHTEDDLYYIQNYSFWLDIRILWKTIVVVLNGQGAY